MPVVGTIERSHVGDIPVVVLTGEHDLSTQPALAKALADLDGSHSMIVDLTEATFIDSTIMGAVITFATHAGPDRAAPLVRVVSPPESAVRRVLDMVAFGDLVPIIPSLLAAALGTARAGR